ncbi:hypothetical protein BJX99DRAFT_148515 [Aspergillus californicus]
MDLSMRSVAYLTTTCRVAFNQCVTHHSLRKNQWAENRLADFSLWADGVGALAGSRASLDSRFQSQPRELALVKGTLVMLHGFLDQCVHSAENGDPVDEATQNVDSALQNLAFLAVAIRRTGRRSRLEKADQKFDRQDHSELELLLNIVLLYRPGANKANKGVLGRLKDFSTEERVLGLESNELSSSQERLLQTNLRRRNRFLQAQRHSKGLSFLQREVRNVSDRFEQSGSGTEKQVDTANRQSDPTPASSFPVEPTITTTSASIPQSKINAQGVQRRSSQVAMTTVTTLTAVAQYPSPPKVNEGLTMFKCPCCCQTLPVEVATEGMRWKKHLSGDISPYSCLLEDCPTPFATYDTEYDWETHVKNKHPPRRLCPFCQDMSSIFTSMEAFLEHVQVEHGEAVSENLMMAVMSHSGVLTIGVTSCPLCDSIGPESDPAFIRHVLSCMHDFSLRSLPWTGLPLCGPRHFGTYNLESVKYDSLSQWLENLGPDEMGRLQISQWDNGQTLQEERVDEYFDTNDYFDLESVQNSLAALERSSRSFSQQEADFEDTEETTSPRLPFPIPSYLLGSRYISRLEAAADRKITHYTIDRTDDDDALPPPSRWNKSDTFPLLELANDGVDVQYTGPRSKQGQEAVATRADNPMSPQCGIYYLEIEIRTVPRDGYVLFLFFVSVLPVKFK